VTLSYANEKKSPKKKNLEPNNVSTPPDNGCGSTVSPRRKSQITEEMWDLGYTRTYGYSQRHGIEHFLFNENISAVSIGATKYVKTKINFAYQQEFFHVF
jgi:hypothetical protein